MTNFIASHRRVRLIPVLAVLSILSLPLPGRAQIGQPQWPSAASTYPVSTDWIPYTANPASPGSGMYTYQWGAENFGTPAFVTGPNNSRRTSAGYGYSDYNSKTAVAGTGTIADPEDVFLVAIDQSGDVKQPVPHTCAGSGDASFVKAYRGIALWRINPSTGAIRAGYPMRLDNHVGQCSLPQIQKASNGNLFIAWKESVPSIGDQISAVYFTVATNTITTAAAPVSSVGVPNIEELSLATDNTGGAAILYRNTIIVTGGGRTPPTNHDQIFAAQFNAAFVQNWGAPDIQIDAPSLQTNKWCPIVKWNEDLGQYDMAWADDYVKPPAACITAQAAPAANPFATVFSAGGVRIASALLDTLEHCEFYMESCRGYSNFYYLGTTVFHYRDNAGILQLKGYQFTSGLPMAFAAGSATLGAATGYPCALLKRMASTGPPQEDIIPFYVVSGAANTVGADYFTAMTAIASPPIAAGTTSSDLFISFAGSNSDGTYLAVPDNTAGAAPGVIDIYRLTTFPLAFSSVVPWQTVTLRGTTTGPYFCGAVTSGDLCTIAFQRGLDWAATPDWCSDGYSDLRDPETDQVRLADMESETYDATLWSTSAYWPYLSFTPISAPVEHNTWHIDAYTAAYQTAFATVYSEITSDGVSNIILGTGGHSWNITNATGDESYYQPKCGVYYDAVSGHYMAIVTYIHEFPSYSTYEDVTVDLTTGTVTPDPYGPIETASYINYSNGAFRNWDVVPDRSNGKFVFIFGSNYSSPLWNINGQLEAVGFNGGSIAWSPVVIQAYSAAYDIDQVRACYNPDPSNSGAYIVWRYTSSSPTGILIGGINSSTGALWSGGQWVHSGNVVGDPCVAAGVVTTPPSYWVFVAWEDRGGTSTAPVRVWAATYDNLGAPHAGASQVSPGTLTSDEAHHPDAIQNPLNLAWPMLAYDRDATISNGQKSIEIVNLDLSLTNHGLVDLPSPSVVHALATDGTCTWSMDDAKWSLYGYMQRRPKLVTVEADSSAYPYDRSGTYSSNLSSWVMCVYEAEAYDLYQNPVTVSGGSLATGGLPPGRYQDMWKAEGWRRGSTSTYAGQNTYLQGNIYASVVNPDLPSGTPPVNVPLIGAKMAVFANTNAQDLRCVTYTTELGPIATCLDYVNTDQSSAIVRVNRVIPTYYLIPPGSPPGPNWGPVTVGATVTLLTAPIFANTSWMPLLLQPATGTATKKAVPSNTWRPTPGTWPIYINPGMIASAWVDYIEPSSGLTPTALTVTGHVPNIYGQWPLSLPDSYGSTGNAKVPYYPYGSGLKRSGGTGNGLPPIGTSIDGKLSISLAENPAAVSTAVILTGATGTANISVLDLLGKTVATLNTGAGSSDGAAITLDIHELTAGSYIVVAVDESGSHAQTMLSVIH